jgi:hypothetical protein
MAEFAVLGSKSTATLVYDARICKRSSALRDDIKGPMDHIVHTLFSNLPRHVPRVRPLALAYATRMLISIPQDQGFV